MSNYANGPTSGEMFTKDLAEADKYPPAGFVGIGATHEPSNLDLLASEQLEGKPGEVAGLAGSAAVRDQVEYEPYPGQ